MASFSSTYPSQRPVFALDAANAGRLDPRMTFSRSDSPIDATKAAASAVHYWSNEKHLSSENLIDYSGDISQSSWTKDGVTETGGQTAPDGGTDAYKLTENSATSHHRIYKQVVTDGSAITFSGYFKYIGRQWVRIRLTDSSAVDRYVWFDIQNGAVGTAQTGFSDATITASGNGYYKVSVTLSTSHVGGVKYLVIAGIGADNSTSTYAGSGADSFAVWGIQVSSTGETVLNETSGQIHREYAPTLKSVATAGQPRFEYDPSTDGQSVAKGILIEGQATNLNPQSDALASWGSSGDVVIESDSAIGPDGTLTADLVIANTTNTAHYVRSNSISVSSSSSYTLSGYFKAVNNYRVRLVAFRTAAPYTGEIGAVFTLSGSGSVTTTAGTATIESVGNGWYRCVGTGTAGTSASHIQVQIIKSDGSDGYAGDGYSGVICSKIQYELGSFASSPISTSGSAATRAAESLSVAMADVGVSQGPVSAMVEGSTGSASGHLIGLSDTTSSNRWALWRPYSTEDYRLLAVTDNSTVVSANLASATKFAMRIDTDDFGVCGDGGTVVTDTAGVAPVTTTIGIGVGFNGSYQANGHVKRVALYNEALSDTNLQALTS